MFKKTIFATLSSIILAEFMLKEFMSYLKRQEPREEEVLKMCSIYKLMNQ